MNWLLRRLAPSVGSGPAPGAPKFALMTYDTRNIGDDIQSLAALQFMPRADYLVLRDRLAEFLPADPADHDLRIVLNGWFMGRPSWPPARSLRPLLLSFHVSTYGYDDYDHRLGADFMLDERSLEYYRAYGPVGCRDLATYELLQAAGVESYFSGCLTLTLRRPPGPAFERREILFVDPALDVRLLLEQVPEHLRDRVAVLGHGAGGLASPEQRLPVAAALLERYARAHLVVTSRLHCALPCLAFDTPVLFVPPKNDLGRFEGLWPLLRVPRMERGRIVETIPWERPEPNGGSHRPLAERMEAQCREFFDEGLQARWQDIEYFDESWKARIEIMARYIPEGASVVDLGCGKMWLREIKKGLRYTGVDYVDRGPGCLVADLNQDEFPPISAEVAFLSGCLEYIERPERLIDRIGRCASACILSYCLLDDHPNLASRRGYGWVSHLTRGELVAMFERSGFVVDVETRTPTQNAIFVFKKARQPAMSPA